jgi:phosphoglycolate phosphatase-like HAD superfamily hydrolase
MTELEPGQLLRELKPKSDFFIGIDSDGCVFDTMELKQKECFCPNFIKHWELQPVSKYAREVWEFVNLYSSTRGINRFPAVVRAIKMLETREEIRARNFRVPDVTDLEIWIAEETRLGNPALEKYAKSVSSATIERTLRWTRAVNEAIGEMVYGMAPFPFVEESLGKILGQADTIVVSQTPVEALKREWDEHGLSQYMDFLAGQEYGTKAEHINYATEGKYDKEKILMVGDAPGDLRAAEENGILFYPVVPGREEESWERFYNETIDLFLSGRYDSACQAKHIDEFKKCLPEIPPWELRK